MPVYSDFDAPPDPSQGEITSVEFDFTHHTPRYPSACQVCEGEIPWDYPHVRAVVWLETGELMQTEQRMATIYLCSRECWADWASWE